MLVELWSELKDNLKPTAEPTIEPTGAPTVEPTPEPTAIPEVGEYFTFGYYEQDNDLENGKEPIEWLVLEKKETVMLVVSRHVLDCLDYGWFKKLSNAIWETGPVRKWLNSEFRDNAFCSEYLGLIVDNPVTDSKLFLLSTDEIDKYFSNNSTIKYTNNLSYLIYPERMCTPTLYAKSNGARDYWLTRTYYGMGSVNSDTVYLLNSVSGNGEIVHQLMLGSNRIGIRPAMWIKIN